MKRTIALLLVLTAAFHLSAQAKTLIPRRVLVIPPAEAGLESLTAEQQELFKNLPFFLFSEITSLKPVILTLKKEEANSTIRTSFVSAAGGTEVICTLSEKDAVKLDERFRYVPGKSSVAEYSAQVRRLAERFVPYLGDVEQEYTVERRQQEERRNRIVKEATFEDSLDKPYQLTLWGGGFLQYIKNDERNDSFASELKMPYPLHFVLDFGLYPSANFGYVFSLYVDKNDRMSFGSYDTIIDGDKEVLRYSRTENFLTLAGAGFSYRTLGRFSAEFNMLLYLGAVQVTAKDDIYYIYRSSTDGDYDKVFILNEGESKLFFFSLLSIQPALSVALNERLSLKARMTLNIDPRTIVNSDFDTYAHSRSSNWLFTYLGEIGIAVRF